MKKREMAVEWAELWNMIPKVNNRDSTGKKKEKYYTGKKYAGYQ